MNYIDRIKMLKSEKKMTNDKLAELTGIPLGTLSKILAGISDSPKLSNMVLIAEALGCSLDYLVSGVPENHHNYTLNRAEMELVEGYRALDTYGRELISVVMEKERERIAAHTPSTTAKKESNAKNARVLPTPTRISSRQTGLERRSILLYDLPVSAGPGVYLDDSTAGEIHIPDTEKTASADFALRIRGNSMEPKFHDGDVVLVEIADSVEVGELGIFVLDGNGYFKKFGGDCLISLNPEFSDILLRDYAETVCCGRVVGKLKRK